MYEFIYHIKFRVIDDYLDVKIFLSLEDLFTPVYHNLIDAEVLKDKIAFENIYREIKEYFSRTKIVINENDLRLFGQTLLSFNIEFPVLADVTLNKYDEELDEFTKILTPKEIIFIDYAHGKAIDDKRFISFEVDNNVNIEVLKQKMVERNYLTTDNYQENLIRAKRDKLLEVVELYDLKVHGENQDLIDMITKKLDEETISQHFSGTHFSLTNKGKKIVERSKKLLDFNRSFFRTIHKLSLEEFHLLSIKKEDYDFNGIGRLVMVNSNNNHDFFDWDSLDDVDNIEIDEIEEEKEKVFEVDNIEEIEEVEEFGSNTDFIDLINQINVNYESREEQTQDIEEEIVEEYEEVTETLEDDPLLTEIPGEVYIEENEKIKKQLESYRKKRELYELNNSLHNKKSSKNKEELYSDEVYGEKTHKRFRVLKWFLIFIIFVGFIIGLLYLNEVIGLIDLPFQLNDLYNAFKETIKSYIKEVKDFIKYVFDYKKK